VAEEMSDGMEEKLFLMAPTYMDTWHPLMSIVLGCCQFFLFCLVVNVKISKTKNNTLFMAVIYGRNNVTYHIYSLLLTKTDLI
jgi:hypothetical protein